MRDVINCLPATRHCKPCVTTEYPVSDVNSIRLSHTTRQHSPLSDVSRIRLSHSALIAAPRGAPGDTHTARGATPTGIGVRRSHAIPSTLAPGHHTARALASCGRPLDVSMPRVSTRAEVDCRRSPPVGRTVGSPPALPYHYLSDGLVQLARLARSLARLARSRHTRRHVGTRRHTPRAVITGLSSSDHASVVLVLSHPPLQLTGLSDTLPSSHLQPVTGAALSHQRRSPECGSAELR